MTASDWLWVVGTFVGFLLLGLWITVAILEVSLYRLKNRLSELEWQISELQERQQ